MRLAWLALLAGCYRGAAEKPCAITCPCPSGLTCGADGLCRDSHGGCGIDAALPDAPPDAPMPDAQNGCFYAAQGGFFDSIQWCTSKLSGQTLDTAITTDATSPSCAMDQWGLSQYCVIIAHTLTINGKVEVTGARPLLLVADTIMVNGVLDATTYGANSVGAGADDPSCMRPTDAVYGESGGAGGAGGSFGAQGGAGGTCGTVSGPQPALAVGQPAGLRGGCPGSSGGSSPGATNRGRSGGALYLLAGATIDFGTGSEILAGGEGGGGSSGGAGGGGGGSGGMIVLDAPSVMTANVLVLANGGGGGGGSSLSAGGGSGSEQSSIAAAAGGIGDVPGGPGSTGTTGSPGTKGKGMSATLGGGGGGGGGAGYNLVFASAVNGSGVFSPAHQ